MGKYEVLGYLSVRRMQGDDRYLCYQDVHDGMRRQGMENSYGSVWRSINSLYSDKLLEVVFEDHGLSRTAKFRARLPPEFQSSSVQPVNNIPLAPDQKSGRIINKGRVPVPAGSR